MMLAALPLWATILLLVLFLLICVLMILVILIQKPMGGGLVGAFGGGGSGQTAFGAKTGDALTITTIIMFSVFVLGAVGLNFAVRPADTRTRTPAVVPAEAPGSRQPGPEAPQPAGEENREAPVIPNPEQPSENPGENPDPGGEAIPPAQPEGPPPATGEAGGGEQPPPTQQEYPNREPPPLR